MALSSINFASFDRLRSLLASPVAVYSSAAAANNLPELSLTPYALLTDFLARLRENKIEVDQCNLEGSAAAACICSDLKSDYNDLDLVIYMNSKAASEELQTVRDIFGQTLSAMTPKSDRHLSSVYISKMFLKSGSVSEDSWALFTLLSCDSGPSIDIKCVQRCQRGYQFTVDSLFLRLDDLLPHLASAASPLPDCLQAAAGSRCDNLEQACSHLRKRIIAVGAPDEMASVHGGGLLKYSSLLSRGFRVAPDLPADRLERFMCARFHIDFPMHGLSRYGTPVQLQRVHDYMATHMRGQASRAMAFIRTLRGVIARSWPHEPSAMLSMLEEMLPRRPLAQCPVGGRSVSARTRLAAR